MTEDKLQYAVLNFKTPRYLFDLDEIENKVAYFRNHVDGYAQICFAIKANPFLVSKMSELTDRIEVCSMGEFEICRSLGIAPEKILISGVLKKEADILKIMDTYGGNCRYTVESLGQLISLAEWSGSHREKLKVYLRLTSGNQFGMDEETIESIIANRENYPFLEIVGIHFFSGTQKKSAKKFTKEISYLDDFCITVKEKYGFSIKELEYGPGLAAAYFVGQEDTTERDVTAIREALSGMKWKCDITIEMGRAFSASCGYYMTTVLDIKRNKNKNYCIVDGGIHQINYDGQIRGMYQPVCRYDGKTDGIAEKEEWIICGSLCTANDVLIQRLELENPKIGDVITFENVGAYAMTEGMSLFLSHELPAVTTYSKENGFETLREEMQTYRWNMK